MLVTLGDFLSLGSWSQRQHALVCRFRETGWVRTSASTLRSKILTGRWRDEFSNGTSWQNAEPTRLRRRFMEVGRSLTQFHRVVRALCLTFHLFKCLPIQRSESRSNELKSYNLGVGTSIVEPKSKTLSKRYSPLYMTYARREFNSSKLAQEYFRG